MSELRALDDRSDAIYPDQNPAEAIDIETLYCIRRPEVVRYLVKFGIDALEAEDIAQEAFLKAFRPTGKKESSEHFFRWLLVCAKHIAIKRYRRGKREIQAPAESWRFWEDTIPDDSSSSETRVLEQERFERYLHALSELNPIEQQAVLFRGQGRTSREVAAALNMPLRSVIYITSVAIQKMRRKLSSL